MPNHVTSVSDNVMQQIRQGKLAMRPRGLFFLGSVLAMAGLVATVIVSSFMVSLLRFSLRTHGPMGDIRLAQLLDAFPWWSVVVAVVGLVAGIWLIRRYEFSYKHNFFLIAAGFIVAIVAAGWLMDASGLNDTLLRHGPMQGMMRGVQQQGQNYRGGTGPRWMMR